MISRNTFILTAVLLFITSLNLQAQDETGSLDGGTISSQYDYMWESSNRYQDHRVVKAFKLNKFRDNVLDSLNSANEKISSLETNLAKENATVSNLTAQIETLNENIGTLNDEKESFSILGMSMSKSSFKTIFWALVSFLVFLVAISFLRLKSKTAIAKEARSNFNLLEGEFEDFKKRAREKEQVLARQLQDEINKNS